MTAITDLRPSIKTLPQTLLKFVRIGRVDAQADAPMLHIHYSNAQ